MWVQLAWVLVSLAGAIVVVLPKPEKIKPITGQIGIVVNVVPWFWLPFTSQPKMSGAVGLVFSAAGILLFAFGFALSAQAYRVIRNQIGWGHAESSTVVEEGPYRFVRHPIYVGLGTAALGWALTWGGVYTILLMPMFYLILGIGAWMEEKQLLKRFGEVYAGYRGETPAFFPVVLAISLIIMACSFGLGILLGWIPLSA